jgi:hypothetical protein
MPKKWFCETNQNGNRQSWHVAISSPVGRMHPRNHSAWGGFI